MTNNDRMMRRKDVAIGWICPECGKVNAPSIKHCDHGAVLTISLPGFVTIATIHCDNANKRN